MEEQMETENIVKFLQTAYSDERLAALLAHAQDGKLAFYSCCCMAGGATADHPLKGTIREYAEQPHYVRAMELPFAYEAEREFCFLADDTCTSSEQADAMRRVKIQPLIIAEQERREKLKRSAELSTNPAYLEALSNAMDICAGVEGASLNGAE